VAVFRVACIAICIPVAAVLAWLALGRPEPRADFVVASDELRTIDPQRVSYMDEIQVANCLFEGLTRLHPETLRVEPAVAESWSVSPDSRLYSFRLRAGLRWSNGDPLSAEDFRFAWLRVLDPAVESQYASLLFVIDGAEAYYRSRSTSQPAPASVVGIEALDERTLRVHLRAPCAYFLDLAAFPTLAPLHRLTLEKWAYRDGRVLPTRHQWTRPENLVCNGPFILDRWDFKRRLLLSRNSQYWDRDAIDLRSIEIVVAASPAAALMAYETGRIDLVRGVEPEVGRALKMKLDAGQRPDFHVAGRFSTFFFRVNCTRPPFDNAALRKALSLAIDRAALCEFVLGLGETAANSYVPPAAIPLMPRTAADGQTVYYQPASGLGCVESENRALPQLPIAGPTAAASFAARELPVSDRLTLARGYLRESGFDPQSRPIRIAYASDPPQQRRIVEAVQSMWERGLGLRVELEVMERKVLAERIRALDYDVVRSDWYGDYLDPATFLDMYTTGNPQNRTGWSNAEYDRLIAAALAAADARARFDAFHEAERILCEEELPIIPIYFKTGNYLLNPRFTGITAHVTDLLPFHRARRKM
jgi:oligopeptide transport system substrate-binding protein